MPQGNASGNARDAAHYKKPPLSILSTTLWEYPSQHYNSSGSAMQGDSKYVGATPSWVIWQLLQRYTAENDIVVDYIDDPRCIGKLDSGGENNGRHYYDAMTLVLKDLHRVLRDQRYLGLYISDSYKKKPSGRNEFMPIGFELFTIMRRWFMPVDIIAVVRHNQKLERANWHKAAVEQNFFLRGFNYLFIMKKDSGAR